jgi:hypothetical protein
MVDLAIYRECSSFVRSYKSCNVFRPAATIILLANAVEQRSDFETIPDKERADSLRVIEFVGI